MRAAFRRHSEANHFIGLCGAMILIDKEAKQIKIYATRIN
jgi:hypothetical protein